MSISETSNQKNVAAVVGENTAGGLGVYGKSNETAVWGESKTWNGVYGHSESMVGGAGVWGENMGTGKGVVGKSASGGFGVYGESSATVFGFVGGRDPVFNEYAGVYGESDGSGVFGNSNGAGGTGLHGRGGGAGGFGVRGEVGNGVAAVQGQTFGTGLAGKFIGDVEVTGDIRLTNRDCAEDFNIGADLSVEPGTVMVLGEEGALFPSLNAYDKRVAGVISGAGDYKPGIVLDRQESGSNRQPVALLGKVYCKVDAQHGAIEVGDLLTTSPTPGHAMKADEPMKAFGAVIGKALRPLKDGQGLIPILIALQ